MSSPQLAPALERNQSKRGLWLHTETRERHLAALGRTYGCGNVLSGAGLSLQALAKYITCMVDEEAIARGRRRMCIIIGC